MGKAAEERPFAEVLTGLPDVEKTGPERQFRSLAAERVFTDGDGVEWRRRGERIEGSRLGRRILDPERRVLHDYAGEVTPVAPECRAAFWEQAQAAMDRSAHSSFYGVDFKNSNREGLLVVHEDC